MAAFPRARNLALEAATGKWVWFVDSDDLPLLNFLEKALHEPQSNDADILMGSYLKMDLNGEITRITPPKYGLIERDAFPVCFMQAQYERDISAIFGTSFCVARKFFPSTLYSMNP